jgi:transcriptional regulator with XRE-family HTH domain
MTGLDLDSLAQDHPAIASATAQVRFIHEVAKLLREMREEVGISQTEMALHLGVTQPRISQIESGKPGNPASLDQIAAYAFHCGVSLSILPTQRLSPTQRQWAAAVA